VVGINEGRRRRQVEGRGGPLYRQNLARKRNLEGNF
jgi:hypothetical protein